MKIKGAIFDMDGTIMDSLIFWDYLWQRIGERYMADASFRPDDEVNKKVRTMIFLDAMTYFKSYYRLSGETEELLRFTSNGICDFYRDVAKPKTGAKALLEHLKAQNIPICLASATAMSELRYALECHGFSQYFDVVLSCADIGVGKERPDIYLKALDLMNLSQNEVCVFEDSYVALETAKKAGFQTVGIFDQYNFEQERVRNASDIYLDEQTSLDRLIPLIHA